MKPRPRHFTLGKAVGFARAGFDLVESDRRSRFFVFRDLLNSDRFRSLGNHSRKRGDGQVAEWFKAAVLKTAVGSRSPWVRIPPCPPSNLIPVKAGRFSSC